VLFRRCTRVYDEQHRFAPVFDESQRELVRCDSVLIAAGQAPDLGFLADGGTDVEEFRPGWPRVDAASLQTTAAGVFVAGDLAHGTRLLIDAVASGKKAARSIYAQITGHTLQAEALTAHLPLPGYRREIGYERIRRLDPPAREVGERLSDAAAQVELVYDETSARREASRCLDCGVTPIFDGSRCVLCGGCVDVCPTSCLKLVPLADLDGGDGLAAAIDAGLGTGADRAENTAILKDEDRCIRCALCVMRCPADAIVMERVQFTATWRAS
jgi:ferredoxin